MSTPMSEQPRVLALMPPEAVGQEYLDEFRTEFVLDESSLISHLRYFAERFFQ
jgi:hypothetical protein